MPTAVFGDALLDPATAELTPSAIRAQAGSLTPGAFGDVIGVPGNPLDDLELIARANNVRLVVKAGEVAKRAW